MPLTKDKLHHLLCSNLLSGAAYIFNAADDGSLAAADTLVSDLPQDLLEFALTVPHNALLQPDPQYVGQWINRAGLVAVIRLPQQEQALLIFSRQHSNPWLLFINAYQQPLSGLLLDKIVGAYQRAHLPTASEIETFSATCYADQFNQPEAGILIDGLAYLASAKDLKQHHYCLSPERYVI